ncbi:hypothetical protein [Streptomyces sp. NPDC049040]|uniref:hypothetical protein n=1 Tax=Streptomyces sp. NPDC049040 TaxID=3365593 RepID=UPI003723A75B
MNSEHDDHEDHGTGTDADDDLLVGGADGGHGQDRPPRGRRLTVALVAAAVLAAAGGGAYWAVSADGGGKPAATHPGASTSLTAVAPEGEDPAGPGAAAAGGGYRLTGTLPADGPASAPLYRPDGGADKAAVGRLATLLGLTGPVVADSGSWRVGSADGTGPALLVSQDAPGTWSYARNGQAAPGAGTFVPPALPKVPPPSDGGAADQGSTSHRATGSGTAADGGTAPVSGQRAEAVAAPVLDGLGLSGARVDATRTAGSTRTVTADPVVGGLPTHGWETGLEVGPDGRITGGHGRLSALAEGGSLPVITADQAYRNLSSARVMQPDHRMSCQVPMPDQGRTQAGGNAAGPTVSPTYPGQDKTLPHSVPCVAPHVPPTDITGAEFGLATQFAAGGQALVPAWLFTAVPEGGTAGSVIAQQAVDPADLPGGRDGGNAPGGPSPASPATPPAPAGPPSADGSHRSAVSGYRLHGSSLTLTFWGGVCETYRGSAMETADQVRVTVIGTVKDPGAACPAISKSQTTTVALDGPLAGRTVVDAVSGAPVKGS